MDEDLDEDAGEGQDKIHKAGIWRKLQGDDDSLGNATSVIPKTWEEKGDVLYLADKRSEALECYTLGLSEDPKNIQLWAKKADIFIEQGRFRSGLFCIDNALKIDTGNPDIWLMRSILLHRAGDQKGAVDSVNYSLSIRPNVATAWAIKGSALLADDRIPEATNCLDYAMGMDKHADEVVALSRTLDKKLEEGRKCLLCGEHMEKGICEPCLSKVLIDDATLTISKSREHKVDVSEAEGILEEAKVFAQKKFYRQSIKVLNPLRSILEEHWVDGAYMNSIIEEAEEIALSLEGDNIMGTKMIRAWIERAKEAQGSKRPLKALVKAKDALELANKIAKKYSDILLSEPAKKKRAMADVKGPICPNCKEKVEDGWVKCPVCKTDLVHKKKEGPGPASPTGAADSETPIECPKCGEEVEDLWVKCMFCGAPLIGKKDGE